MVYDNISHKIYYLSYFFMYFVYIRSFYTIGFKLLENNNNKFNELTHYKKKYVVKNMVKSVNLLFLIIYSLPNIIYPVFVNNSWDNNLLYKAGLFYASNDFAALTYITDLPANTRNHHIITTSLSIVGINIDYKSSLLGRMVFIYAFFSSISYPVNTYLGIRHLYDKEYLKPMKKITKNIYALSLSLNWGWHIYTAINNFYILGISHYIYFFALFWIIKDDIILMRWLSN